MGNSISEAKSSQHQLPVGPGKRWQRARHAHMSCVKPPHPVQLTLGQNTNQSPQGHPSQRLRDLGQECAAGCCPAAPCHLGTSRPVPEPHLEPGLSRTQAGQALNQRTNAGQVPPEHNSFMSQDPVETKTHTPSPRAAKCPRHFGGEPSPAPEAKGGQLGRRQVGDLSMLVRKPTFQTWRRYAGALFSADKATGIVFASF